MNYVFGIAFILLIILVCIICYCISAPADIIPLVIGGINNHCGIIGGSHSAENNRNKQIEEYRKKYSPDDILKMTNTTMKTGQYIAENNSLQFVTERLKPPYSGLIFVLRVKKYNSALLADLMVSLSLRESAFIVLINEQTNSIIVLGTSDQLEKMTIGHDKLYLIKFLDSLADATKIGFNISPNVPLIYEKSNSPQTFEWDSLAELTEDDISKLDWSEMFDKIEKFTTQKYEVGGSAKLENGKIKIVEIMDGNIGSININNSSLIVFHSHPKSGNNILEPPSVNDLYSALFGHKDKSAVWDVVIAQEGLYVYRPSRFILPHDKEIRQQLDNLTIGCYGLKPSICIPIVLNRIRDLGFIIYFLPNKKYFSELRDDYAMNYWNQIDNTKFLKDMEAIRKYTSKDFEKLDWSEITNEIKNAIKMSHCSNIIVADIVAGKIVAAGGAGCRSTRVDDYVGVIPGRYPALLDIFTQSANTISGYQLHHIIEESDYVAFNIFIMKDKSIAVRAETANGHEKIKVDIKREYSVEELPGLGFKIVVFGKV
jgi:hypothetical protein